MTRLRLPIHDHVEFVLVRPHYPENVGASARAMKTMGFDAARPGAAEPPGGARARDGVQDVGARWDVLDGARREDDLEGVSLAPTTFSPRARTAGFRECSRRMAASLVVADAARGKSTCFLFGNEKTGLSAEEIVRARRTSFASRWWATSRRSIWRRRFSSSPTSFS